MSLKISIFALSLVLSSLFAISNGQNTASICSEKNKQRISLKFTRLWVLGDRVRKFPETLDELTKFCNDSKKYLKDVRAFNEECSPRYSKQLASVLFYRIHEFLRDLCGNDAEKVKQLFNLEAFTCANAAQKVLRRCNVKYIQDLEVIPSLPINRERWPTFCCAYETKIKCYLSKAVNVGKCDGEKLNSTIKYHEALAQPIAHSVCADVLKDPNLDQNCNRLITQARKRYKLLNNKKRAKSMFFPFMNAIESVQ